MLINTPTKHCDIMLIFILIGIISPRKRKFTDICLYTAHYGSGFSAINSSNLLIQREEEKRAHIYPAAFKYLYFCLSSWLNLSKSLGKQEA